MSRTSFLWTNQMATRCLILHTSMVVEYSYLEFDRQGFCWPVPTVCLSLQSVKSQYGLSHREYHSWVNILFNYVKLIAYHYKKLIEHINKEGQLLTSMPPHEGWALDTDMRSHPVTIDSQFAADLWVVKTQIAQLFHLYFLLIFLL